MTRRSSDFCDGISRRAVLQAGLAGAFGLSLPDILQLQAQSAQAGVSPNDHAVIFLELAGGPTQHETYDPKPDAPKEYRGALDAIKTNVPDILLSQYMAEQAKIMDKLAIIRSIHHDSGSHGTSAHLTQTGYYLTNPRNRENNMPSVGSVASKLLGPNQPGMPAFVSIPNKMRFGGPAHLGQGHKAYETGGYDSKNSSFKVRNLELIRGLSVKRLEDRRKLLKTFEERRRWVDTTGVAEAMDDFSRQAFELVAGPKAKEAFDLSSEDKKLRERYDMNKKGMGQSVLLARRLVERGVTFVSVRMSTMGSWDDHNGVDKRMKAKGPFYDKAVAALVSDLHERGLDKKVLVVAMGEFGRTPKVNKKAGRDHWGKVMSVLMAGGGLKTGQVVGSSDAKGAVPKDNPYRPENVLAVVYRHLGINPAMTLPDTSGRPRYLLENRKLIEELI